MSLGILTGRRRCVDDNHFVVYEEARTHGGPRLRLSTIGDGDERLQAE